MDKTNEYYKNNANSFIEATLDIDMSSIYNKFLPLITKEGKILDAGCGSGRDSYYFKNKGFYVIAIDNCNDFVEHTKNYAGVDGQCLSFNQIEYSEKFDGIWACASLLHLDKRELQNAFLRLSKALKYGGVLYSSFKYGTFSGERNGRIFTDMNEQSFSELIKEITDLKIKETWITSDQRKDRDNEKWLNVLIEKKL